MTTGDIVEGTWKAGVLQGKAKVTYQSGDVFEGHIRDGLANGVGTMRTRDGME